MSDTDVDDVVDDAGAQRNDYWRGCAASGALNHRACQPNLFPMIASTNWQHIADYNPELLARL